MLVGGTALWHVTDDGKGHATDEMLEIPAVGAKGGDPLPTFSDNLEKF